MIKFIPLKSGTQPWYLTLGGELRWRFESFQNPNWGLEKDQSYLLQRYMLHGDLHFGPAARIFLQLRSAFKTGGEPPEPIDEDNIDIQQAFGDVKLNLTTTGSVTFRTGRQELLYGSTRLISVREGANIRRSFDGFKAMIQAPQWEVDLFLTRPVALENGGFNDRPAEDKAFWGAYAVHFWKIPGSGLDLYYLGLKRDEVKYAQGKGRELRHTTGARLWGVSGNWDYDLELTYQFGKFRGEDIRAWMAATHSGHTFRSFPLQPRLGLKIEIASGDRNLRDPSLQTFNSLFSNPSLFNETDHIGLANIIDIHPYLTITPIRPLRWTFDWAFFWRQSTKDALYDNVISIQRPGNNSRERYVGSALSTMLRWQATRHWLIYGAYTHFFPGAFIKDTGPAESLDFFGVWATYKF